MQTLLITVGASGSGKTTFRKTLEGYKCVSPDDIRKEVTGNISDQSKNNDVWIKAYERLRTYLECGYNVIFDSTACNVFTIKNLQDIAEKFNCEVLFKLFETDEQTAFDRIQKDLQNKIERSNVPRAVIRQQLHNYELVKNYLIDGKFTILEELESDNNK